jgi:hypothetical protein
VVRSQHQHHNNPDIIFFLEYKICEFKCVHHVTSRLSDVVLSLVQSSSHHCHQQPQLTHVNHTASIKTRTRRRSSNC